MTRKADGKPAQIERMAFTRPAAERIAKAVRTVEAGDRDQPGITFGSAMVGPRTFRLATFTGAWPINTENVVTLQGSTATLLAVNRFFDHPNVGTRNCAVARDGTAWYLVQWQWNYSVATVFTGATLGTAALTFSRANVVVLDQSTATTVAISITNCSTAAT